MGPLGKKLTARRRRDTNDVILEAAWPDDGLPYKVAETRPRKDGRVDVVFADGAPATSSSFPLRSSCLAVYTMDLDRTNEALMVVEVMAVVVWVLGWFGKLVFSMRRNARHGGHFWGCPWFSRCTGTRRPHERGDRGTPPEGRRHACSGGCPR